MRPCARLLVASLMFCRADNPTAAQMKSHIKYKMLHKMWSQNFKCAHASLDHHTPEVFTRCFWQKSDRVTIPWLLYKLLLAVYTAVTWYLSFINFGREVMKDKYFIYLTNWSYCLLTLQCIVSAIIVLHRFIKERRKGQPGGVVLVEVPTSYKMYWVLYSVCMPSAIMVTTVFWGVIFNPKRHPVDIINISTHALNSVVSLIDFWLVAHPYRLFHFFWTLGYALIYAIFTVVYYYAGGTDINDEPYIYKILDWRSPNMAMVTCLGVLIATVVIHIAFWGLHRLKKFVKRKCWASSEGKFAQGEENLGMEHKQPSVATIVV